MGTKSTQEVIDAMRAALNGALGRTANAAPPQQSGDFSFQDFDVTYPNGELIVEVEVTGVPKGATLLGVTVAAAPDPNSQATYCMGVAADAGGLSLPLSVVGASTLPSFPTATSVTGIAIIAYSQDGPDCQQFTITQQFTVGG